MALDITPMFVTYAVMDREYNLLKLRRIELPLDTIKVVIPTLHEAAEWLYPKLANLGDIYVMEQPSQNMQQVTAGKMTRHILQGMIHTMLNFGEPDHPKVGPRDGSSV